MRPENDEPVKVIVQLPQMPRYHEQMMVDTLTKKMRAEYGEPPPRRPGGSGTGARDAGVDSSDQN